MTATDATTRPANDIAVVQNLPPMLELLRARDRVYQRAKWFQGLYVVATIVLAIVGAAACTELKPFFGLAGILAMLLDVSFLEQYLKDLCKLGARLGEDFDTRVLRLPANTFVADKPVPPEDVRELAAEPANAARERQFRDWYEFSVGEVPLAAARLICQRLNGAYDSALRRNFAGLLLWLPVAAVVLLLFAALITHMEWTAVVSSFSAFLPALSWALRERRKHLEIAGQQDRLRGEFDRIWARALAGANEEELEHSSRQLQDAIYRYRASTTLIFDWFYQRSRLRNEDMAAHVARTLVDEFLDTNRDRQAARPGGVPV